MRVNECADVFCDHPEHPIVQAYPINENCPGFNFRQQHCIRLLCRVSLILIVIEFPDQPHRTLRSTYVVDPAAIDGYNQQ